MIKLLFLLYLILLSTDGCSDEDTGNKATETDSNFVYNSIFENYNTLDNVNKKLKFIEKFKSLSNPENHLSEFDIENVKLENTRQNFFRAYLHRYGIGIDGFFIDEKFQYGEIYNNSKDAKTESFGYILKINSFLINKSKEKLYFITWQNNNHIPTESIYTRESSTIIDSTTKRVITNLDTNLIKKAFNYYGEINPYKIGSIDIQLYDNKNDTDFVAKSRILADSSTYLNYLKNTNPKKYKWIMESFKNSGK